MHTSSRTDPPKRPERLRDSCNSCAQAKVRCTRDKPVCARCATKSLRCDYSPSMRKGKQRTTGGSISSTKKPSSTGSPRKSLERSNSLASSHSRTTSHQNFQQRDTKLRTPSPPIPWNDNVWISAGGMGDGNFPGLFSQDVFAMPYMAPQLNNLFPTCDPVPGTFGADTMNLDCAGIGAFADISEYGGDGTAPVGQMDDMDVAMLGNDGMMAFGQLHQQEPQQYKTDAHSHSSPSAMSSCSTTVGTPRTNDSTQQHDCMARALDMMAEVNSTPSEEPGVPLQIRILVRNKTIVDSIAQILQCGICMQEMRTPHFLTILTISLIASYHSVLQSFAGDHSGNSSSSASSSTTTTPPPNPASSSTFPQPNTATATNTIAPALAALSGLGIDAPASSHGVATAQPAPGLLHSGATAAGYGPLPPLPLGARPAQTTTNPLMSMMTSDAKSRMQIIFTELARVRTLVDAMADALRECGRAFDERAAVALAANEDGASGGDGGSGSGVVGGESEGLTHSAVLAQLEKVLRAKERSVFQAVVRAVR